MNRIQFLTVTIFSSIVALSLIGQIILFKSMQSQQVKLLQIQQTVQRGEMCFNRLKQLAGRTGQVYQQTQDEGLKQLLARQNISMAPPPAAAASPSSPVPAPAPMAPTLTH